MDLVYEYPYQNERGTVMNSYRIGLIDEDPIDIDCIKRTILINKPKDINDEQVDFWEVSLSNDSIDIIVNDIVSEIVKKRIQILIVDYKIVISTKLLQGTEIFRIISDILPRFPIIMLSNLSDDCYRNEYVDADKVYSKKEFFKIEEEYSKEKVANIFRNMDKYISQRSKLATRLTEQLSRLKNDGYSAETLQLVLETEKALDNFTPQNQNAVEKALDLFELKKAVEILKNAQELIGGKNED